MMTKTTYLWVLIILVTVMGCKKPYNPPAIASPGSYLVVAGVITAGPASTTINLSRTVSLSSASAANPVLGAIVSVQSNGNVVYPLTETGNGNYTAAALSLDNSQTYRLSIKTSNNEQYYSDYVPLLNAPPIDSLFYTIGSNGITIYSNAHDPTNTVKYYRWDYTETWIVHSNYDSGFVSNGDTVLQRTPGQQVYTCWPSDTSSSIIVNSTAKLSRNILVNNPIISIASNSDKLGSEYSIILRQYALTGDAYNFWNNIKTNTQDLGSIFDAQPSTINGNIHCITNPSEPVIGYISAGSISSKRIFIYNKDLPDWVETQAYPNCQLDTALYVYYPAGAQAPINQVNQEINYDKGASINALIPIAPIARPMGPILGYTASSPSCVDCTFRGTNVQPSFWIY
jgi:hypothetical protein